jgi:hypothetical protein
MTNTTELFQTMKTAEAAFNADDMNTAKLDVLETAEKAYFAKVTELRAKWAALPEDERKDSAEQNAHDTEDTAVDQLRWYEIALSTYEEIGTY